MAAYVLPSHITVLWLKPQKEMLELALMLAQGYDFAASWPYTREQLQAAMTPGHPGLRSNVPDEYILVVAEEVEKRLLVQLAEEGVALRDPTQAGMLVVRRHPVLCVKRSRQQARTKGRWTPLSHKR